MSQHTDRELLELAAKAAGYDIQKHPNYKISPDLMFTLKYQNWNPLVSDGDALRMSVKLYIYVAPSERNKQTVAVSLKTSGVTIVLHGDDPYAATRRAIVRAAATIGEALP